MPKALHLAWGLRNAEVVSMLEENWARRLDVERRFGATTSNNNDDPNPSCCSFLIDLDLEGASGARGDWHEGSHNNRAFLGEQHSFMHDLESFFLKT